jgi:parallel beta-helix repeat protein
MKWQEWKEMERTNIRRNYPLFIILFLLSISCIAPGAMGATSQKNLSIDPENHGEISPATPSIQDMINTAPPNTTIQLPAGTITEVLTITKPLHLQGQGTTHTYLAPTSPSNGYAIRILAKGVLLSDLAITNQGLGLYTTCVKVSASYTTIQNCTFHDTPIGIALWSSNNTITGCEFRNCDDEGIVLLGTSLTACTSNTISSCIFSQNCDGIELQYATHTLITSCRFLQNTHAGIDAIESNNNDNTISFCTFTDNQAFGLYLARSSETLITHCSFSDDSITFVHTTNTTILKSQITRVHLLDDSTLLIDQCTDITVSDILSQQSSFEIRTEALSLQKKTHLSIYQSLFLSLLSRFKSVQSLYEYILESRM